MTPDPNPAGEALIVVDVQNDFITGSLAVPNGIGVIEPINALVADFGARDKPIFYTKCFHVHWHPSFVEHGGLWPAHCVIGTEGAELHPSLDVLGGRVIPKGVMEECYSGFEPWKGGPSVLERMLRYFGVDRVVVVGIATDYCVKFTALDAIKLDFATTLYRDACAGVTPDTTHAALEEMAAAGVTLVA